MSPRRVTQNMDKFASNKFDIQHLGVTLNLKFIENNLDCISSLNNYFTSPVSSEAKNLTDSGAPSELRFEKLLDYRICRWAGSLLATSLAMSIWKQAVAKILYNLQQTKVKVSSGQSFVHLQKESCAKMSQRRGLGRITEYRQAFTH